MPLRNRGIDARDNQTVVRHGSGRRQRAATVPSASAQPEQNAAGAAEHDPSSWYLKQAQAFEKSKVEAANEKAHIADRRSKLFGVVALAAVSGMGALGLLKRPNPPAVLRVDRRPGRWTCCRRRRTDT